MSTPAMGNYDCITPTSNRKPLIEDQFVSMGFVTKYTGLTDKWFYKLIQEGKFPPPVKFGRRSRWLKSELEAWILARIQASRAA
ncbi:helix-turn-helix transcriptional regulator [Castellaniella sp.]|uniref:helix-turn-helix transcriptional regulator n=1 Tax=Castellaniella sp. TaxID=1955812 RepID=UPI003C77D956